MMPTWEEYLALEQEKLAQSAREMQAYVDKSGLSMAQLEMLGAIDLDAIEPELRQQLTMEGGITQLQLQATKPTPSATTYRQKKNVMAV